MGRFQLSNAHSSLRSLASALLVASAHNVVEYPIFTYHLCRSSPSGSSLVALSRLI